MRALGFDVKKSDVLKILKDYDREASGKISFEDFQEVSKYVCILNHVVYREWNHVVGNGIML